MKLIQLEAFVAVVESAGFAAAARELGQTRSRVNRDVRELEDSLGTQLLTRTTRIVAPTAMGLSFYERARNILAAANEAKASVDVQARTAKGRLRITAPLSFGMQELPSIISAFSAEHPDIEFDLQLDDRVVDISTEGYDLALRISSLKEDSDDVDFRLAQMGASIVASPAFLAQQPVTCLDDLEGVPWLAYGNQWRAAKLDVGGQQIKVKPTLFSNNGELLAHFAAQSKGVTVLPTFIARHWIESGQLVAILPHASLPPLHLTALYPRTRYLSFKVRLFTDFLIDWFAQDAA